MCPFWVPSADISAQVKRLRFTPIKADTLPAAEIVRYAPSGHSKGGQDAPRNGFKGSGDGHQVKLVSRIIEHGIDRKIKQVTHSGYTCLAESGLLDDQTIDQKKDLGYRRSADRPNDDYSDSFNGVGDRGRRPPPGADEQLHPGLRQPGAYQHPVLGAGTGTSPERH